MANEKKQKSVTVGFIALGCPKNVVDSERMLAEIARAGLVIAAEPENADVVVINTCGFIAPARAEALEAIRHAVNCKAGGTVRRVIVAGCLPERLGEELFDQADGIDAIVGLGQRDNIARIIKKTIGSKSPGVFLDESPGGAVGNGVAGGERGRLYVHDDRTRLLIAPGHWAYIRISEGCNHGCSFCTIPAIRGRFRSKPKELILAEAIELVSAGVVELNVIAQDCTSWGRDLKVKAVRNAITSNNTVQKGNFSNGVKDGLAGLAGELEKITGLKWIRLMYLYPAGITEKLIGTIAASEKIVHYFDMPIQHINNKILKDMRRSDSKERICSLIENLRAAIPDVVLRTTLIVGFPGESDEQFEELLEFIRWAKFDCLGCFEYYCESGTEAAEMAGQIPDKIKQQRLDELMLTQQEIVFAKNKSRIGTGLTCLLDSVDSKGTGNGRFYGQAPDIDSICIIRNCSARPGDFLKTKVIGTKDYDLIVEQI